MFITGIDEVWNAYTKSYFTLKAHLICCFGDMPAMEKILHTTGTGGRYPCRFCKIRGYYARSASGRGGAYYYPSKDPVFAPGNSRPANESNYNLRSLPLRDECDNRIVFDQIQSVLNSNTM